jgi:LysM repeat protein
MRKILIVSLFLFLFTNGFSQTNEKGQEVDMVIHNVQLGETVRLISQKYLVAPSEIYKYNKFATDGISEGMVLYIPVPKKETVYVEKEETIVPEPAPKQVVVKEKEKEKEVVVKEVSNDQNVTLVPSQDSNVVKHKVEKQETLYGLSKKYNITVEELKEQNQAILKNGLQIGQVLTIKKNN